MSISKWAGVWHEQIRVTHVNTDFLSFQGLSERRSFLISEYGWSNSACSYILHSPGISKKNVIGANGAVAQMGWWWLWNSSGPAVTGISKLFKQCSGAFRVITGGTRGSPKQQRIRLGVSCMQGIWCNYALSLKSHL